MLEAKLERRSGDQLHLSLSGSLDEEADLGRIFSDVDTNVTISLKGVKRLNSIGVHRWITAIGDLSGRVQVSIESCSYPVALQASYVANMFGKAVVASTLAPYFCPSCGYNGMVTVQANEVKNGVPAKECPSCNTMMQFDELDTYLTFLSSE